MSSAGDGRHPDALVVVPALNEEHTVGSVVAGLRGTGFRCVVVDDGSIDATARRAREAGAVVLRLPFNLGVGGALRCGFRYAVDHGYQVVVQCDADGQHPPSEIERLLSTQRDEHAHLVIGSRFLDGPPDYRIPRTRRLVMRALTTIVRRATGLSVTDSTSGFRCIAAPLLTEFAASYPVHYLGDTFEAVVVAARAGYRVVEVPVAIRNRSVGTSTARPLAAARFVGRAVISTVVGLGFRIRPYDERSDPPAGAPESRRALARSR